MKSVLFILASAAVMMSANLSFAGCGAVVCTQNNSACTVSHGEPAGGPFYENRFDIAIQAATSRCEAEYGYGNCELKEYECNACTNSFTAANGNSVQACY